jgi:hypothetical protein
MTEMQYTVKKDEGERSAKLGFDSETECSRATGLGFEVLVGRGIESLKRIWPPIRGMAAEDRLHCYKDGEKTCSVSNSPGERTSDRDAGLPGTGKTLRTRSERSSHDAG